MTKPKIIFMGTPEFAVPALEVIHTKYGISAVVTVPDKPKGRGLKLIPSPVKEKALELGIEVMQPEKLKDEALIDRIKSISPDIIVVIAFRILPRELYSIPKIASFNIHGSLLPKYRGAAPINHAVMNGETRTGLTSFILQDKVDTGEMLLTSEVEITESMTAGELHDMLMPMAADLSISTIKMLFEGNFMPQIQDESLACPAPKLTKENTIINWDLPAEKIYNFIRGLSPHPTAWTIINGEQHKILGSEKLDTNFLDAGNYTIEKKKFIVGTAYGDLSIKHIQPPNKKAMLINDFLNGFRGNKEGKLE
ncbi:MAG: methionyl-tRNA formyltransferase [Candidatus Kapabacteria bacterium]|nr:methionyl-tRNA formyltransferase [Ignavibacteriota bacterium]MCW5886099.1 methionyl-tRNA formyltransferase [Candidatus Kapabacteria bacterium]